MLDLLRSDPSFIFARITTVTPDFLQLSFDRDEVRSKLTHDEWRRLMIDGLQPAMDRALEAGLVSRITYHHDETAFVVNVYRDQPAVQNVPESAGDFFA